MKFQYLFLVLTQLIAAPAIAEDLSVEWKEQIRIDYQFDEFANGQSGEFSIASINMGQTANPQPIEIHSMMISPQKRPFGARYDIRVYFPQSVFHSKVSESTIKDLKKDQWLWASYSIEHGESLVLPNGISYEIQMLRDSRDNNHVGDVSLILKLQDKTESLLAKLNENELAFPLGQRFWLRGYYFEFEEWEKIDHNQNPLEVKFNYQPPPNTFIGRERISLVREWEATAVSGMYIPIRDKAIKIERFIKPTEDHPSGFVVINRQKVDYTYAPVADDVKNAPGVPIKPIPEQK